MVPDWDAEGLLDDLEGRARDERIELLRWLEAEGFPLERIREGHDRGLLPFLGAARAVSGDERYTIDEIVRQSGLAAESFERLRRANGLPLHEPGIPRYTANDLQTASLIAEFAQMGLREDQMEGIARVMGRGLGQASEVMRAVVLELALEPGASETELAQRYAAIVEVVMPRLGPLLEATVRLHLEQMVASEAVLAEERMAGRLPGARETTVSFADLVGFTRMGEQLPPEELGAVADRLARIVGEVVAPPVRLVKTIGDAVMLVSPEPEPMVGCALDIVAAVDDQGADFPQVHVGVAHGEALNHGGDWYGRSVNLASRVTAVARAGSVLATDEAREGAGESFRWSFAGERRLKGVPGAVRLFRARRAAAS